MPAPARGPEQVLVNDGSSELGPPPASAWAEATTTTCEWIGDFSSIWGVAACDGLNVFWAGGYCGTANVSTVTQTITIPAGETSMSFQYMVYRQGTDSPAGDDLADVSIDGTDVWTPDMSLATSHTYPSWVAGSFNFAAYAGSTVALQLGNRLDLVSGGDQQNGNMLFDFVELATVPVELQSFSAE